MGYIAELKENSDVEHIRQFGEITFEAKLLPIIGIETSEENAEKIKKLPCVVSIRRERIGTFQI